MSMNIMEVNKRLKQRPPFQMIERVSEIVPGESAVGVKCVSINEPWFVGHFPNAPVMPGVLLIEAAAQLCSLVTESDGTDEKSMRVLLKVDGFKFVRPVLPGDTLTVSVKKTRDIGGLFSFDAVIRVGEDIRAKGSLTFTAVAPDAIFGE